jgi:hypothetical protein
VKSEFTNNKKDRLKWNIYGGIRMYFDKLNKYKIRQQALLEAIRFCGGVAAYSDRLKVSRTRASNWCNRPEITIPYEYAVLTEVLTRVSIERLSPFTETANKAVRYLRSTNDLLFIDMPLKEIIIEGCFYYQYTCSQRSIIVGTDMVLIAGLFQIESLKTAQLKKIRVIALDLEAMLLGFRTVESSNYKFLTSEKIAIGLRLEHLIHNRLEKDKKLLNCTCHESNKNQPYRICDEVKDRFGEKIAHITGFCNKAEYHNARYVYLHGTYKLIDFLDKQLVSILKAWEIVRMPLADQDIQMQEIEISKMAIA